MFDNPRGRPVLTRRAFAAAAAIVTRPELRGADGWEPRIAENIGGLDASTLTWLAQLGHKWIVLQGSDAVDRDAKGYWSAGDIHAVQSRCREFGMELHSLMIPIAWLTPAMLAHPDRDRTIANIARSIRAGGEAGVTVFEWRWSPDFKWGADAGYEDSEGRGGSVYKSFRYDLVRDKRPFEDLGLITRAQLQDRMRYFLDRVLPEAERAGVRLSLHPKDPPVRSMRGIERLLTNTGEIERFVDAYANPMNGFTFCQGTVTEMGVDVVEAIRRIGGKGRIHHVHFRGVRGRVPNYTEVFIDEGDVDMVEAMRAYRDTRYRHALVSDHTPRIPDDPGGRVGRSFSHGYIRGLVQAVNSPAVRTSRAGRKLKVAHGPSDVAPETLAFIRQMGIGYATMPASMNTRVTQRPLVPPTDRGPRDDAIHRAWTAAQLRQVKEHMAAHGVRAELVHLPPFPRILHGRPGAGEELEAVKNSIRAAGEAGIPVVEYNFYPLRASEGYGETKGRGSAGLRDFDAARIRNLPPLANAGSHTREQMWERLSAFLKEAVPVAERAGVRLAVHPNDPPVPEFRGAAQPVRTLADLKRLIETVDSPSNGITLDTGVTTEMGEDAPAAIRYFGSRDRINHVHFRNVRVERPYERYTEVFHDEGQCDLFACMRAFDEVRYPRLIIPDHTPHMSGDDAGSRIGWAFALGYMRALAAAV
ncbi:MAG: mannonate dehydratase [Bryobacteraceae bacterium]